MQQPRRHTRVQKEGNFALLNGCENHARVASPCQFQFFEFSFTLRQVFLGPVLPLLFLAIQQISSGVAMKAGISPQPRGFKIAEELE